MLRHTPHTRAGAVAMMLRYADYAADDMPL